jgi:riboflavin synthase
MFTGIIEETGIISDIRHDELSVSLVIKAGKVMDDLKTGDSIAVNGVCLTVTSLGKSGFCTDVIPESLHKSNLGKLTRGSRVNLERALPAGGRLGGHIVTGHIDGTGTLVSLVKEGNAFGVRIRTDETLLRYLVEKGSVAVDGISLTVASLEEDGFRVFVIPFTREETILLKKKAGETVNIECDVLGKYVERLLGVGVEKKPSVSWDFLKENGFL